MYFEKDGIKFVPRGDGFDDESFISTTREPKIINGTIVSDQRRYIVFNGVEWAIKNGYKPTYKKEYNKLGYRGYFGFYKNEDYNKKVYEINKLIDEYNSKINTFDTEEENFRFANMMNDKIYYAEKELP